MATVIRRFAETPETPWRNGLGQTWEVIDADLAETLTPGFAWRLSVAHLAGPAPFSVIPGVQRTLVPWGGDIRLAIDDQEREVRHGDPTRFPGGAVTRLVALDRPCHAVNLMASGNEPTLVTAVAGERFDDTAVVLTTETTTVAARFDVVRLEPREPLPSAGVVVRLDGD